MFKIQKLLLSALFIAGAACDSGAQTFTRTPFVQKGSYNKATICWRLSAHAPLTVKYGTDSTNLSKTSPVSIDSTDACVALDSTTLTSATKYYYAVYSGATKIATSNPQYFFTSPSIGSRNKYTFWIIGDAGQGTIDQVRVKGGFVKANQGAHVDGFLMLGDNAYNNGLDAEFTSNLFSVYSDILSTSFSWPCIGNHEVGSVSSGAPYLNSFNLPTNGESGGVASGSELYYSFDYGNIHFIILDSQLSSRATTGAQYLWLQQDLQATRQDWIIAYWHHPPYSYSGHNSDNEQQLIDMRTIFNPLLEKYGVDILLAGHSHDYERSYLLDSAYGNSSDNQSKASKVIKDFSSGNPSTSGAYKKPSIKGAHQGAVYMVAGTGGGSLDVGTLHPMMYTQRSIFGSVILTVQDTVATTKFIDSTGAVVDQFQIVKTRGVTAIGRPALKQNSKNSTQFLQMGRRFQFAANNAMPFRIYSLSGMLLSQESPHGTWEPSPKAVPTGAYYFRFGTRFGKISIP